MDLWTHNDKSDQVPGGAEDHGTHPAFRSTRRLTDRAILSLFRTWLLQEYTFSYGRSLGATRIFRRCYWIDGLGGLDVKSIQVPSTTEPKEQSLVQKGRRKNQPQSIPPALQPILELSQTLSQESRPITLHGLLLIAGNSKRQVSKKHRRTHLENQDKQAQIKQHMPNLSNGSGIITASWLEAATTVLQEIEQSPAIFLLNPLGPVMFNYDDMMQLYQRTVPTELFLLIPHKIIESSLQSAAKATAQATALTALLRSDRWKSLPTAGEEAISGFLNLFVASMQRHFRWSPQRIELPIYNGPASIAHVPYTLIYATRGQDSLGIMNDAYCNYQRKTVRQSYRGILGEEWFVQQEQERRQTELNELTHQIHQQGVTLHTRRWPDLRQQLLLTHFGHHTQQEYDNGIRQLIEQGEAVCIWRRTPEPGEERAPGNEDTLRWR